ncbi:MAG: hypothetical protein ACE14Q_01425 [Acidobacteriota bacterium]
MKKIFVFFILLISSVVFGQQAKEIVNFFKPNYGWAVEVPFKDFVVMEAKQFDKDCLKIEAYNDKEKVILDFYFDKGTPYADSKKVRDYYENIIKQSGVNITSIEKWEKDGAAFLIYKAKGVLIGDPPKDELNGSFYRSKGSTWIDVRFRIQDPKDEDKQKIAKMLDKVKFVEGFEPSSEDNLFMGTMFCLSDFPEFCISCYSNAYDKEKKIPQLKRELRIALIQNYADALRLEGNRKKAMEVLNYGLAFDNNYPMYYWIKARIYANEGDEENTIRMIKQAVENAENLLPGEKFPDPRQDEAFKILGLKESFKQRMTEIFAPKEPSEKSDTSKK